MQYAIHDAIYTRDGCFRISSHLSGSTAESKTLCCAGSSTPSSAQLESALSCSSISPSTPRPSKDCTCSPMPNHCSQMLMSSTVQERGS